MKSSKLKNLVKRNGWWSFRVTIDGTPKWIALGTENEIDAITAAAELRRTIQAEKLRARLEAGGIRSAVAGDDQLAKRLGFVRQRPEVAKVHELVEAYRQVKRGSTDGQRSIDNTVSSFLMVGRIAKGEGYAIENAPVSIYTGDLVRDFENNRLRIRREVEIPQKLAELKAAGTPVLNEKEFIKRELDAMQTTIKSSLNQARSVVQPALLQLAAYRELKLPDFTSFRSVRVDGTTVKRYRPLAASVIDAIEAAEPELQRADPEAWKVLMLEFHAGMRAGSVVDAVWDWFVVTGPDQVIIEVNRAKGGETNIAFPWAIYAKILELKTSPTFIIGGSNAEARAEACHRLKEWLRARGLIRRLPNHEIRKLATNLRRDLFGSADAQNFCGHDDEKLTNKVYSKGKSRNIVPRLGAG